MQTIKWYEVYTYGYCEGRTLSRIGCFSTKEVAEEFAKGKDGHGRTILVEEKSITICDTVEENTQSKMVKSIEGKKLTKEEIEYIKNNM